MTDELALASNKTALLVMDYQVTIVGLVVDGDRAVTRAAAVVAAARAAALPVIYPVIGFRPGYPEASPRNLVVGALTRAGRLAAGAPGNEVHPALAPRPDDITVV